MPANACFRSPSRRASRRTRRCRCARRSAPSSCSGAMYWNVPRIDALLRQAAPPSAARSSAAAPGRRQPRASRQAEVEQLDARLRQHHVAGLQVAMDDARRGARGRARRRSRRRSAASGRAAAARAPAAPPASRLRVLHDQVLDVVSRGRRRSSVQMCGMGELGDRLRLALEALPRLGGRHRALGQHLDRDDAIEPRVRRLVDLSHPTGADRREDLVRAETGTRGETQDREEPISAAGDRSSLQPGGPVEDNGDRR